MAVGGLARYGVKGRGGACHRNKARKAAGISPGVFSHDTPAPGCVEVGQQMLMEQREEDVKVNGVFERMEEPSQ